MSNTVAIIQARLGSTRFPRKVLADLCGKPVLQRVIEQADRIRGVQEVVAAIPAETQDPFAGGHGELASAFMSRGLRTFIGEETDVLDRYERAARWAHADVILRITCDCPLLNPDVATDVLEVFSRMACDFCSNDTLISGYPDGWDVEVFSVASLETAHAQAIDPHDREHVTPWMKRHLRCQTVYADTPWTGPKLSIDTPDDLEVVRAWLIAHPDL